MKTAISFTFIALTTFLVTCANAWETRQAVPMFNEGMPRKLPPNFVLTSTANASDIATLKGRMRSEFLGASDVLAPKAIATLSASGEWSDINYADRSVGEWTPMAHLERIRAMAIVYSATKGKYSNSAAVREGIVRALRAWVARSPQSDNWWHNTIGVQLALAPILVLMDAELPSDLRSTLLSEFVSLDAVPADRKTGQNLVWYAMQLVVKGVLTSNSLDIAEGRDAIRSTLALTTGEGFQADLSFHQHGNQLYSGGYGLTLLVDTVQLAIWLQGTEWHLPESDLNFLADYATVGIGSLVWGDWLDWGARGREITRQETTPRTTLLRRAVNRLVFLTPDRYSTLNALLARLGNAPPAQISTHGFWRSDFLSHQTPNGYFSVKMVSKRTVGTESGNGENLLGYWLPFGTTFIVGKSMGNEYLGLQPLFNWSAMPGTTTPVVVPSFNGYLRHREDRVAVLNSPSNGMACMQVNTYGLQVKKFWFFDGEMMVALGADIHYTGPQRVHTTLNQTRWVGTAESNVATLNKNVVNTSQSGVKWLTHGDVGYLLLDDQSATLSVDERRLIADPTTRAFGAVPSRMSATQFMTLSIDHGINPKEARYAYAVVHGIGDTSKLKSVPRPKVLVNSAHAQGVMSADGTQLAVVFHQPSQVELGQGLTLQADQAVAVLGQNSGTQLQLQVIDLAGGGGTVTLRTRINGQTMDQQTQITPSNIQRTLQTPAASMTLATMH